MDATKNNSGRFVIPVVVLAMVFNLAYIDILTFLNPKPASVQKVVTFVPSVTPDAFCPASCLSQIREATASYKPSSKTPTITSAPLPVNVVAPRVKEFFIAFGSGSNSSNDWQDVPGLQAYIDSNNYPHIKSVTFEASVHVPTGNETANVRLFNATDKHPVWSSEVLFNGGGSPQLLISKPITFDEGNKLYKVQMKTQLQFQAILDQARIHIITK